MFESLAVTPQGGRLCRRALLKGSILVGVLHFPPGFNPIEGACYVLTQAPEGLRLSLLPLDQGLPERMQSAGVGDLLQEQIWNKTLSPEVMTVRFLEAFPKDGIWTVYGASLHSLPEADPAHAWFDVQASGELKAIAAPFAAAGTGIGQMLSSYAVWPDRKGDLYTLPQLQSSWRPHFLAYHKLLISAARDPDVAANLEATVRNSKVFREISIGRIDREYCAFLAHLDDHGLVGIDAPRTAEAFAHRSAVGDDFMVKRQNQTFQSRKSTRPA